MENFQVSYPTLVVGIDNLIRPGNPVIVVVEAVDRTEAFIDGSNDAASVLSKRPNNAGFDTSKFPSIVKIS